MNKPLQKAKDLTVKLTPYVGKIEFIEVPFTEVQEEIKRVVPYALLDDDHTSDDASFDR